MTTLPLWLATLLYLWQADNFAINQNYPMMVVFLCYAGANVGFIWAAR